MIVHTVFNYTAETQKKSKNKTVLSLKNNLGIMHSKNVWESRTADMLIKLTEGALRKGNQDVVILTNPRDGKKK